MICNWKPRLFCLLSRRGQSSNKVSPHSTIASQGFCVSLCTSAASGPHVPCVSESWLILCYHKNKKTRVLSLWTRKVDILLFGLFFFIDLYSVCIRVSVLRGSSPTERKQAPAAIRDVSLRPQVLRLFYAADISLQKSWEMFKMGSVKL